MKTTTVQSINTRKKLKDLQSAPLRYKIIMTQGKLEEWVEHWGLENVYISFSGGKDSTVLLDIARQIYPTIQAVFVDTGLEYPEVREFVKNFDNVKTLYPKTYNRKTRTYQRTNFADVITQRGYPVISKRVADTVHGARLGQMYRTAELTGDLSRIAPNGKTQFTTRPNMHHFSTQSSFPSKYPRIVVV